MSGWKRKRTVKRRYDLTASMYDARYKEEQEVKYQAALANSKPTGLVLDMGCGTGLFFNHVSEKTVEVVGVDISKLLLQQARARAKKLGNVNVVQADGDYLPFKSDLFDEVFAFTVLQNMPKPSETLAELRRIAREGAAVTVTGLKKTFCVENLRELICGADLGLVSVKGDETLKCYVAFSVK